MLPLTFSCFSRVSVQNEVFDPESRNAYVSTNADPPFAFTRTGTIANAVAVELRAETFGFVDILT